MLDCDWSSDVCSSDLGDAAVALLRDRLDRIYAGHPHPLAVDRAMARVVVQHALPRTLLDALIEGFEWDAQQRVYETLDDLEAYAARVAGTIGAMMALLMGVRDEGALARACDLGVAMQYTNIARDVGEDARNGRLYLPRQWLREAGVNPEVWLAQPAFGAGIREVIQRLLYAADDLYARVASAVAQLPAACRPGINAARYIYADIGREVRRRGYDSISQRAVVTPARKAWLLMKAYSPSREASDQVDAPPLAATGFLIDSVSSVPARPAAVVPVEDLAPQWWQLRSRALWLIELFERLERRERMNATGLAE
jgi:phytoene synthase